jgi:hypothetical protein
MYNSSDFLFYEELLSFFDMEGDEMLSKLNIKLLQICEQYKNMDCFIDCPSGDKLVIMNPYQEKIAMMFSTLLNLWLIRN